MLNPFSKKNQSKTDTQSIISFTSTTVELQGKLEYDGTMHINSRFIGEITSPGTLLIGSKADIHGKIRVGSLCVYGQVNADALAEKDTVLHTTAVLLGELRTPSLRVETGAKVRGKIIMEETETEASGEPSQKRKLISVPLPAIDPAKEAKAANA